LLASNEVPQIGSHFATNATLSRHKLHSEKADQLVIDSLIKRSTTEEKTNKVYIPTEYHDLFKLIPKSSSNAGHQAVGDDFETSAQKVPKELVETDVNWAAYGFYSTGS